MNICVVGWYFNEGLMSVLEEVSKKHCTVMVCHRSSSALDTLNIPFVVTPNIGLEFGAYDYFLKNLWDGESDALLMHDDSNVLDVSVFDDIADLGKQGIDQAYIFKNQAEQDNNGGKHGRAMFMSSKLLNFMNNYECNCYQCKDHKDSHNPNTVLKGTPPHTGFWFDPANEGHVSGKPPAGVRHYNEMIYHFHRYMGWVRDRKLGNKKMNVLHRVHYPALDCARRGVFRVEKAKKKKKG